MNVAKVVSDSGRGWTVALFLAGILVGSSTQWIAYAKDAATREELAEEVARTEKRVTDARAAEMVAIKETLIFIRDDIGEMKADIKELRQ